jgi:hypothetical protein
MHHPKGAPLTGSAFPFKTLTTTKALTSMKTKNTIILTAAAGFISGWLCSPAAPAQNPARTVKGRESNPMTIRARPSWTAASHPEESAVSREEAASFAQWEARFAALLTECGSREAASGLLLSELDQRYDRWVEGQLADLGDRPYVERLDAIADMEASIREGAAAILNHLEIPGDRQTPLLAASMEALSAEVQYGMSAPTHEQRVALQRLDKEREVRLTELLASAGEEGKIQAMSELDGWYDAGLRQISGSDELN